MAENERSGPRQGRSDLLHLDQSVPPRGKWCWLIVDGEWVLRSNLREQVEPEYGRWLGMHKRRGPLDRHAEACGWRDAA